MAQQQHHIKQRRMVRQHQLPRPADSFQPVKMHTQHTGPLQIAHKEKPNAAYQFSGLQLPHHIASRAFQGVRQQGELK